MRAVVCQELGPPSGLVVEDRAAPVPGPGQVVVAVEAAGVNYVDALFVSGQYQIKPQLPFVPGSEIAGTIAALGPRPDGSTDPDPDAAALALGDRVLVSCGLGGFAEQVAVTASSVVRRPANLDAPRGAAFTQSYATALFALRDRAGLRPGETVLVLGAGGGVGLACIDVAGALGAHPIGAASSPEKREAASQMGARAVIDTTTESVKDRARVLARELVGPDRSTTGVDVAVDPVGGDLAEQALRGLGEGGRLLVIGFASGTIPRLPANQVLLRNRSVLGVDWGAWAMAHGPDQARLLDQLLEWVADDRLRPPAPTTYPLDQAAQALDDLTSRRVVGKVVLVP